MSVLADHFRPGTFVDSFRFMNDHFGLLLHKTLQHLELSGAAIGIALLLALPLGVWLGTSTAARSSRSASPTSGGRSRASC